MLVNFTGILSRQSMHSTVQFHVSATKLAGHSKWANIRHIKALKDGQRSSLFTRLSRQIRLAVQEGGSANPAMNTQLRQAIDEAQKNDMPMVRVQQILKKIRDNSSVKLKKMIVELKGLNRVCALCIVYTENVAATRMTMAPVLRKNAMSIVDLKHLFIEKGFIVACLPDDGAMHFEEQCTEHAIECDAEEFEILNANTRNVSFTCDPMDLDRVRYKLSTLGYRIQHSEYIFIPKNTIQLASKDMKAFDVFKDKLKAIDGVEEIFDNIEWPEMEEKTDSTGN